MWLNTSESKQPSNYVPILNFLLESKQLLIRYIHIQESEHLFVNIAEMFNQPKLPSHLGIPIMINISSFFLNEISSMDLRCIASRILLRFKTVIFFAVKHFTTLHRNSSFVNFSPVDHPHHNNNNKKKNEKKISDWDQEKPNGIIGCQYKS